MSQPQFRDLAGYLLWLAAACLISMIVMQSIAPPIVWLLTAITLYLMIQMLLGD